MFSHPSGRRVADAFAFLRAATASAVFFRCSRRCWSADTTRFRAADGPLREGSHEGLATVGFAIGTLANFLLRASAGGAGEGSAEEVTGAFAKFLLRSGVDGCALGFGCFRSRSLNFGVVGANSKDVGVYVSVNFVGEVALLVNAASARACRAALDVVLVASRFCAD